MKKQQQQQEKKRTERKILVVLNSYLVEAGMFHSEEEHNRTVELVNELQYSDGSTNNVPTTFELGQTDDFDFGFDFECDFGREGTAGVSSSFTSTVVSESQSFTTFTPEDKWPI